MKINQDLSESVVYTVKELPIRASQMYVTERTPAECHWHDDFEFIIVEKGTLNFFVDGKIYCICEGCGIFVNSARLHYGYAAASSDCRFTEIIIGKQLYWDNPFLKNKFIDTVVSPLSTDCLLLDHTEEWHQSILQELKKMYLLFTSKDEFKEIEGLNCFNNVVLLLFKNIRHRSQPQYGEGEFALLNLMLHHIRMHFGEKLTIDKIAKSAGICRSECCKTFQRLLHKTPINFLQLYRIEQSKKLLCRGKRNITEVSLICGFDNSSYFGKVFRKLTGVNPKKYVFQCENKHAVI